MSVELEHNGERYIVDGGRWYRRLESTETLPIGYQFIERGKWQHGNFPNTLAGPDMYRVPCTDPRPPFVVGQRVKVARKDESWAGWSELQDGYVGHEYHVLAISGDYICLECGYLSGCVPPWCLDPVETTTWIQRMDGYAPPADREAAPCGVMACNPEHLEPDINPELEHILRKLKPLTDRAADVRRIKRECYQKLAALLPEEKR